jgi:hypothetical protein
VYGHRDLVAAQETLSHAAAVGTRRLVNLLLIAAVVAAAVALLTGRERPQTRATLTSMDPASIHRITVERQRQPTLRFVREDGNWRMTAPVTAEAHHARINAILHLLQTSSQDRIDAAGADLHTLNLDPAPLTVRLDDAVFLLGGTDPVARLRYVLYGDTVYLVKDSLFYQLTQPAAFFVSTQLLPGSAVITRITYPDHDLYLEGGTWHGRPAETGRTAASVAAAWRRAEAVQVLPYREEATAGRVMIRTAEMDRIFEIIPDPTLQLGRRDLGVAYQLSKDTAASLGLGKYIHK